MMLDLEDEAVISALDRAYPGFSGRSLFEAHKDNYHAYLQMLRLTLEDQGQLRLRFAQVV